MNNICVCCGAVIPEGSHVCTNCLVASAPKESKIKPVIEVVLDDEARMPTWAHDDDAGMDLYSREDVTIHPNVRAVLDTGVHLAIPKGWCGYIKSRSGLMSKKGVVTDGTIDSGYRGSIGVILFNLSGKRVEIKKGERIAQITFHKCEHPTLVQVDSLDQTDRGCGGFGSTGKF